MAIISRSAFVLGMKLGGIKFGALEIGLALPCRRAGGKSGPSEKARGSKPQSRAELIFG